MSKLVVIVIATFVIGFSLRTLHAEEVAIVTEEQLRFYKFGIEFGCRDQGSRQGDTRTEIAVRCGCVTDALKKSVPDEKWKQAASFSFSRQGREEAQIMGPYFNAATETCQSQSAEEKERWIALSDKLPSIVGVWTWTRPVNQCTERYEYKEDGTFSAVSGEEKSDNKYVLEVLPDSTSRYLLTSTMVKDYGGKDCGDSDSDDTGYSAKRYVFINYSGDMMMDCRSPTGPQCFGPLSRVDAP